MTETPETPTFDAEELTQRLYGFSPQEREARERAEEDRYAAEDERDRDQGRRVAALDMALRYGSEHDISAPEIVEIAETFHRFLAGIPAPTPAPTSN